MKTCLCQKLNNIKFQFGVIQKDEGGFVLVFLHKKRNASVSETNALPYAWQSNYYLTDLFPFRRELSTHLIFSVRL